MNNLDFKELKNYLNIKLLNKIDLENILTQDIIDDLNDYMLKNKNPYRDADSKYEWEYGYFITKNNNYFGNSSIYQAAFMAYEFDERSTHIQFSKNGMRYQIHSRKNIVAVIDEADNSIQINSKGKIKQKGNIFKLATENNLNN